MALFTDTGMCACFVALAVLDCRDMTVLGSEIVGTIFWLYSSLRLTLGFHQTPRPSEHIVPLDCLTLADDVKTAKVRLKNVPEGAEW
ncbi:hypothetical protein EDB89DRAFT_2024882 [Lactarius sanguifluus]|nr:hypothetical protein EDB89DRAFT_2024882 [Lactarius sanguifluus]